MSEFNNSKKIARSDEDLARMIANVANVAQADAIICATVTEVFAKLLHSMSGQIRVIAATTKRDTYDVLIQAGYVHVEYLICLLVRLIIPIYFELSISSIRYGYVVTRDL
jgi:pyruvate kinase